jgi:aminoglycoside phosphotransferase (APT) family kinase protein
LTDPGFEVHLKEQSQALDSVRVGLEFWMRERLDDPSLRVSELRTPSGTGVANETVLFDAQRADATEGYVARLATSDSLYLDYDLSLHYRMYEAMMAFPSVPTPGVLGYEADSDIVGAPFFVMERIDGAIPTDAPSWASEGFVVDAEPTQRHALWERTVHMLAAVHALPAESFEFVRTHKTSSGVGDCIDYWMRSLRWAAPTEPIPLAEECEEWLLANQPDVTALSWGDSRLPNVIYRDFTPVGLLDWDLVSLAGPQLDLAWWITLDPPESQQLDGIGSYDDFIDLWEEASGQRATDLHWYLVLSAYRLAGVFAKLFSMMVEQGHMTADAARAELAHGMHVQLMAGLLELSPPDGVTPRVPNVRLDR